MKLFLTLFAWLFVCHTFGQSQFQERVAKILYTYDTLTEPVLMKSLYLHQKGFIPEADRWALQSIELTRPNYDSFWLIGITGYSGLRQHSPNDTVAKRIKYWLKNYQVKRGKTENHDILGCASYDMIEEIILRT
jgi:hypothetical protein